MPSVRVSVMRYQPSVNPHDVNDSPWHLPASFSENVLANTLRKFSLFHDTWDGVEPFREVERLEVDFLVAHRFVRGPGGSITVLYETRWIGVTSSSRERETHLSRFRSGILRDCTGTPN